MIQGNVLLVDDDESVLKSLQLILDSEVRKIVTLTNPNLIPEKIRKENIDIVLLDMNFSAGINSGNEGLFWLSECLRADSGLIVILLTAYGEFELAVKGVKNGAFDFLVKPWDNNKLLASVHKGWEKRGKQKAAFSKKGSQPENIDTESGIVIGNSYAMKQIFETIKKVATTDANILITGENGTGKGEIAKQIHDLSDRKKAPFIHLDLGAIPSALFESELFGHKKGAFTDAKSDKQGRICSAGRGTVFLDEIGNLPLEQQAKLLTTLQERQVYPLGSNKVEKVEARFVFATNQDLHDSVSQGKFREDLFYRINTISVEIPSLRDRKEDIEIFVDFFLKKYGQKYSKPNISIANDAVEHLRLYAWPGNIRELENAIEKAVILAENLRLEKEDFPLVSKAEKNISDWPLKFEEIEKQAILRALDNNKGKLIDAAKELGLTRQTIYNKMKKYGIN